MNELKAIRASPKVRRQESAVVHLSLPEVTDQKIFKILEWEELINLLQEVEELLPQEGELKWGKMTMAGDFQRVGIAFEVGDNEIVVYKEDFKSLEFNLGEVSLN